MINEHWIELDKILLRTRVFTADFISVISPQMFYRYYFKYGLLKSEFGNNYGFKNTFEKYLNFYDNNLT